MVNEWPRMAHEWVIIVIYCNNGQVMAIAVNKRMAKNDSLMVESWLIAVIHTLTVIVDDSGELIMILNKEKSLEHRTSTSNMPEPTGPVWHGFTGCSNRQQH